MEENPLIDKSDPYLIFYNLDKLRQSPKKIYKTEIVMDNLEPTWRKFSLRADTLCNSDPQQ